MKLKRHPFLKQFLSTFLYITLILPSSMAEEPDSKRIDINSKEICNSLVIIEFNHAGVEGKALGVIAEMNEKAFILTNQHILLGIDKVSFITAGGEKLTPRSVELSTTRDIARLALSENSNALPIANGNAKMNTPIVLINADSENKNHVLQGSIIGIGGIKFEISTAFGEENNGAPILNKEGQIIGISSYSQKSGHHAMKKGTRFDEAARHFCSKINHEGWKKVNWKNYNRTFGSAYREHKELGDRILNIIENRTERISKAEAQELATACRTHSRQIELQSKQKGMTDFLASEFEEHTELFEFAEEFFTKNANQ